MLENILDRIGNINPQLFRELKGHLNTKNIFVVLVVSCVWQMIIWLFFQSQLPIAISNKSDFEEFNKYCTGSIEKGLISCLRNPDGSIIVNWQLWNLDVFAWLSIIACYTLLALGVYLLVNDLSTEQRRETLNFLRLTPQKPESIFLGKFIGVPILVSLGVVLTLPLHIYTGLGGGIAPIELLGFYAVVVTAICFYFSTALICGLVTSWLGGFQEWLTSGLVLGFLTSTQMFFNHASSIYSMNYLRFLNPFFQIPHLHLTSFFRLNNYSLIYPSSIWEDSHWLQINLDNNYLLVVGLVVVNYLVFSGINWISLKRIYSNPQGTMLSKRHSYGLMLYFVFFTIGFSDFTAEYFFRENISYLLFLDFLLLLYLMIATLPHRQTLADWARYRHLSEETRVKSNSLVWDLIWGEKSPATVAIAIISAIATTPLIISTFLYSSNSKEFINSIYAIGFAVSLAMLYTALAQLLLLMKSSQRIYWTFGVISGLIILPIALASTFFGSAREPAYFLWLSSITAPLLSLYPPEDSISITLVLSMLGIQLALTGFFTYLLQSRLQVIGQSNYNWLVSGKSHSLE
ncbi:hypothetical protein [Calothrix sp. 336/3]|uniref:hypothetical protein n=1 Tax=Calothrix sp. 336/3 TaxID=1337936 RepID=UPI0004E31886|nr:hypothetical protein [Calothrix sp. 336/3]AKG24179.1 hypothetical protein IJ00_25230 [Calothrix sp. 336/3]